MEELLEKNAFYVVRKGDVVGVYENLSDCVAEAGSLGRSPPVTVLKGYNLRGGQTEEYLKSYGLKNALYSVHASALENGIFGRLFPSHLQQIIPPAGKSTGHSSSKQAKRPAEFFRPEADVNGFAMTSSLNSSNKHAKLEGFFPRQAISPGYHSCILEFDGAAKGNPGPAGAGAILHSEDGSVVFQLREGVGRATKNAAEYRALILGLRYALEKGYQQIQVRGDSKLICMQGFRGKSKTHVGAYMWRILLFAVQDARGLYVENPFICCSRCKLLPLSIASNVAPLFFYSA